MTKANDLAFFCSRTLLYNPARRTLEPFEIGQEHGTSGPKREEEWMNGLIPAAAFSRCHGPVGLPPIAWLMLPAFLHRGRSVPTSSSMLLLGQFD